MTTISFDGKTFMVGKTDLKVLSQALKLLEECDDNVPTLSERERLHLGMLRKLLTQIREGHL